MKAIALLSGGLDSTLATKLIIDQGIEVVALNFVTVFLHLHDPRDKPAWLPEGRESLGIPLKDINTSEQFLDIVQKPEARLREQHEPVASTAGSSC